MLNTIHGRSATMSLTKTVSENLHALRVAKGLTQQEVASRAKITVSYVSMLERGNRSPPLETLEVLARALKVPPLQLLEPTRTRSARR
jgi:transcriptional regulator with XRE-family HTH domain